MWFIVKYRLGINYILDLLFLFCSHRPVLEKKYDIDHVMKVLYVIYSELYHIFTDLVFSILWLFVLFCPFYRLKLSESLMNVLHPSCLVIHPMRTTIVMPAQSIRSILCRCQCCASMRLTTSFPPITVSFYLHVVYWTHIRFYRSNFICWSSAIHSFFFFSLSSRGC